MHKRLVADLMSLAHEILTLKDKEDIFALKEKATELHEKISVLAFVEEYVNTTPNIETTKEELTEKIKTAVLSKENKVEEKAVEKEEKIVHNLTEIKQEEPKIVQPVADEEIEQPFDELEEIMFAEKTEDFVKNDKKEVGEIKTGTLEEELKDTISIDVAANLFDIPAPKSLNDKLVGTINIGLNDRIAFVKNLFNGSQEDYNRVVSQLNTFKTEKEAKKFINKMVKPDYDWAKQEELETRFMEIVERKFS